MNNFNYILTADGFKNTNELLNTDYVYDLSKDLSRVLVKNTLPSNSLITFKTSVDEFPFTIPSYYLLNCVNSSMQHLALPASSIQEEDWLYIPWLDKFSTTFTTRIDLSKYCNNYYDSNYIYVFKNKVLKIAETLNITSKMLEEILMREAAEYDEYLDLVKVHIKLEYGLEEDSDDLSSFSKFKKFCQNNFVYKIPRFLSIDKDFLNFILMFFIYGKLNKNTNSTNKSVIYEINFNNLKTDLIYIKSCLKFLDNLCVKYTYNESNISIYNKPLYMFLEKCFEDFSFLNTLSSENQDYVLKNFFKIANNNPIYVSLKVALQFKEFFFYNKQVLGLKKFVNLFEINLYEDDFDKLDSNLIIETSGYYVKVLKKLTHTDRQLYTHISVRSKFPLCFLNFTARY